MVIRQSAQEGNISTEPYSHLSWSSFLKYVIDLIIFDNGPCTAITASLNNEKWLSIL